MNEKEFASFLDAWIAPKRDEIVDCLLRLLSIPSVGAEPAEGMPFGEEVDKALRFVVAEADRFRTGTCTAGALKTIKALRWRASLRSGRSWRAAFP